MKGKKREFFFSSLQFKYAMSYIGIIAVVLALLNTYPVLASQDLVFHSKRDALTNRTAVFASALTDLKSLTAERVEQVFSMLDDAGLSRILVTDPAGLVLYDSALQEERDGERGEEEREEEPVYRYALLQEVVLALQGWDVAYSDFRDGVFVSTAAAPIQYRAMTIGAIYICEEDGDQGALLLGLQRNLRTISLVIALVVLALSLLFSRMFTSRIGALLRAIRVVGAGNYAHRIQPQGNDELTRLAEEFNQLTGRLETTEEARRRFVSDASHELKTPLASIRLLTDSILQSGGMDPETVRDFVGDIGSEAERLTRITEKLLTLTRLDSLPPPEDTAMDVGAVAEKVLHMLSPVAQRAGVALERELEEGCLVMCTGDDLYQIGFNLVENAIKYTPPGGRVLVRLCRLEGQVRLQVRDTGVGIPEEDQDKVFDRFYRVDKARSRAAGGTGLGLSIVRDTVLRHGGRVSLSSVPGEGSLFTVSFPQAGEEGQP